MSHEDRHDLLCRADEVLEHHLGMMAWTAKDMNSKYKETSEAGLACP